MVCIQKLFYCLLEVAIEGVQTVFVLSSFRKINQLSMPYTSTMKRISVDKNFLVLLSSSISPVKTGLQHGDRFFNRNLRKKETHSYEWVSSVMRL